MFLVDNKRIEYSDTRQTLQKFNLLTTFQDLGLSEEILKAITEMGFETPSDIQTEAIPLLLESDSDFIGLAQTGTGKTAAFGLPLLEQVDPSIRHTQALILAPTRELGKQIAVQLDKFGKYLKRVNSLVVYGGTPIMNQMRALKDDVQHVIIATPGRLLDLIKRKAVKLDHLKVLVLDEADEMLNMGFKEEIDNILSYVSSEKNTWLFSATMPNEIKHIVNTYMNNPREVKINAQNKVNTNIEHQYVIVQRGDKVDALKRFLDALPKLRGVVFCRTKRDTQELAEILLKKNYKADALHGDLSQVQRDRVMQRFRSNALQVLIATDVAARGIDVNDLTHVFHYALPDDQSYYTHRSGRTARAGKKGTSIAFISSRDRYKISRMEKQLGVPFTQVRVPNLEDVAQIRVGAWCQDILDKTSTRPLPENLLEQAKMMFDDLSKEELISRLLLLQLGKMQLGSDRDLNPSKKSYERGGDRDSRRRDNRRRGGGEGRNRGRSSDRSSSSRDRNSDRSDRRFRSKAKDSKDTGGGDKDRSARPKRKAIKRKKKY